MEILQPTLLIGKVYCRFSFGDRKILLNIFQFNL